MSCCIYIIHWRTSVNHLCIWYESIVCYAAFQVLENRYQVQLEERKERKEKEKENRDKKWGEKTCIDLPQAFAVLLPPRGENRLNQMWGMWELKLKRRMQKQMERGERDWQEAARIGKWNRRLKGRMKEENQLRNEGKKRKVQRYTAHQTQVTSDTKSSSACKKKQEGERRRDVCNML